MPDKPLSLGEKGGLGAPAPTPAAGGSETTPPSVPAESTSATEGKDWKAEYDAAQAQILKLQQEHRGQISGLQSSLDSQISELHKTGKQRERALEEELNKLRLSTLDEPERAAFEKTVLSRQVEDLEEQISDLRGTLSSAQNMSEAIAGALEMGLPLDQLDLQHGAQGLGESIWRSVHGELTTLRSQLSELKKAPAVEAPKAGGPVAPPPLKAGEVPPPAVAAPAGTRVAARTWQEVFDYVNSRASGQKITTEEEIWQLVGAGRLPLSIVPGFEHIPDKKPSG